MVLLEADNIVSPLGFSTDENLKRMFAGKSGIHLIHDANLFDEPFTASVIPDGEIEHLYSQRFDNERMPLTRLEKMIMVSISNALSHSKIDIRNRRTLLVLSTTKGNIDLLEQGSHQAVDKERVFLWKLGAFIGTYFGNPNPVMVLSNACISGVLAINTAAMLIRAGMYDSAVVCGADRVTRFVVSGFQSFKSVSVHGCRPFDAAHDGLTLGEAAGTVVLTNRRDAGNIAIVGGASANDANHISGPSRTGEGSTIAIKKALEEAGKTGADIDHISAHGTATPYNDEMESIALGRHHLEGVPVNSLKGYWGHTLGAAGILETIALAHEMKEGRMLKTLGYETRGVSVPIRVVAENQRKIQQCNLKMASGFGGCNAALILEKQE